MSTRLALSLVPPVLFGGGALLRLPLPGRRGASAATCLALACFAVGLTLNVDPVYTGLDAALGVPNVADLLEHVAVIVGATVLLGVLRAVHVSGRAPLPSALLLLGAAVIVAAVVLFAVAPLPVEAPEFTERYAGLGAIRGYWAVQVAFLGIALVELIRIAGYARKARRVATRAGFALVGVGAGIGLVYSVNKLTALAASADPAGAVATLTGVLDQPLLVTGTLAIGVGLLLPPAATATRALWEPLRDRWDVQLLRRLWLDLAVVNPRLFLAEVPSRWEDFCDGANLGTRRYRIIVEILDAATGLRNYVTPVLDQAALRAADGLRGPRRDAIVDACWLTGARARYLAGAPPTPGRAGPLTDTRSAEDEVARHLRRVAWARAHSRRVARFTGHRPPPAPTPTPASQGNQPAGQRTGQSTGQRSAGESARRSDAEPRRGPGQ